MLEKLENLLLKNITILSLVFIIIILLLDLIPFFYFKQYNFLSTYQTITFIGAILAFLFGYKKYERDKEFEIINKYASKYNELINSIFIYKLDKSNNNFKDLFILYRKLNDLFFEEFYLYKIGYLNERLWKIWENYIKNDIKNMLIYFFDYYNIDKYTNKKDEVYESFFILTFGENLIVENFYPGEYSKFLEENIIELNEQVGKKYKIITIDEFIKFIDKTKNIIMSEKTKN